MKVRPIIAGSLLTAGCLVLGGCGGGSGTHSGSTRPSGTMTMPDGTVMSSGQMAGMGTSKPGGSTSGTSGSARASMAGMHARSGPSAAAAMICSNDTRGAVRRTFELSAEPTSTKSWSQKTFRCVYRLPGGELKLAVKDLSNLRAGHTYFERASASLPGSRAIHGLQALGHPAFETATGQVGFLKDGKTLLVDASGVPAQDLPRGIGRTTAAYGVAAAVIACWSG